MTIRMFVGIGLAVVIAFVSGRVVGREDMIAVCECPYIEVPAPTQGEAS